MKEIITQPGIKFWLLKNFGIIVIIILCLCFFTVLKQNIYLKWAAVITIFYLLTLAICNLIIISQTKYIIKEEQIIIITGILIRKTNYIEMYRIYDYCREQTILEFFFGLMTVKIMSRDVSHPLLIMKGIPNDLSLIDEIRNRVENQKRRKGVYEINN